MKRIGGLKFGMVFYKIGNSTYYASKHLGEWRLWSFVGVKCKCDFGSFASPKAAAQYIIKMHETCVMSTAKTDERLLKIEGEIK